MKSLIPWRREGSLFDPFRMEMEDLFTRFFGPVEKVGNGSTAWTPRVDVEETEKEIAVKVDLPGVEPKDVELTVDDGVLTIRGERKEVKEEKKKAYHKVERFVGSFYREVPLPVGVDAEKVSATATKGVITVSIPKKPGALPKKIAVTAKES